MTDFDTALRATLAYEGGRVDNPADPGGRTAYGVTQRTFNAYQDAQGRARRDVWTITQPEVAAIYKAQYWDKVTQGRVWPLNAAMFDAAVNSGPANAEWMLGEAKRRHPELNTLQPEAARQAALARALIEVRRQFFRNIVARRPASGQFLAGWLKRCDQLGQLCSRPAPRPLGLLALADELPQASPDDFTPRTDDLDAATLGDTP